MVRDNLAESKAAAPKKKKKGKRSVGNHGDRKRQEQDQGEMDGAKMPLILDGDW